jgi:hypothetical protein
MYGVVVVVVAPRGRRLWDERVDYFSLFVGERRSLGGEYGDLRRVGPCAAYLLALAWRCLAKQIRRWGL